MASITSSTDLSAYNGAVDTKNEILESLKIATELYASLSRSIPLNTKACDLTIATIVALTSTLKAADAGLRNTLGQ